jgi:hypothetical protein
MAWCTPFTLVFRYQEAPDPTWHSTQATSEWGDVKYVSYSGCITEWQVAPQNCTELM